MSQPAIEIPAALRKRDLRLHVLCNSHIDREWTEPYQFTRIMTVRFLDSLLALMDAVPEYQFLLDSQTLPLEDYLEVRPENASRLRALVAAQRLWIGPWYSAPDFSCIFGESIIRNLLLGHQVARDFGHVMKVGYTPFGFGQISQLPQIYAGFGIDVIWFYRGVTEDQVPGICFQWIGADGTEAFCSRANRYNFFAGVVRPVTRGGNIVERDYDYCSQQVPVRFCDARRRHEHALLAAPRNQRNFDIIPQKMIELLEDNVRVFQGDVLSMMNGLDTLMPQRVDDEIIQRVKAFLPDNWQFEYANMPAFVAALRAEAAERGYELPIVRGEQRSAGPPSPETTLLGDIITARPAQKRRNAEAEMLLQRNAEPVAALAWLTGGEYPQAFLRHGWRELCKCHPHDTIAGAGVDQIEKDLLNRLDQVAGIADGVLQFAMGDLLTQVQTRGQDATDIPLVVCNPSAQPRSEIVTAQIDIPNTFGYTGLQVVDAATGSPVDAVVLRWDRNGERVVRDLEDATTSFFCAHVEIEFVADDVPALGYRTFLVRKAPPRGHFRSLVRDGGTLENAYLRVTVQADGTVELHDKATGRTYRDLIQYRDRGETGNAWISRAPTVDTLCVSRGTPTRVSVVQDSPLRATVQIEQTLRIPSGLARDGADGVTRRSTELVDLPIVTRLTLTRDARALDVQTEFVNDAKNHVLQVLFPTDVATDVSHADAPFDVIARKIERDDRDSYAQTLAATHPMLRYADLCDGAAGLGVTALGVRGYQVGEDARRALTLTLLRAFEISLCTVTYRWEKRADQELSQAPGRHVVQYTLVPHAGDWQARMVAEAERLHCPLLVVQTDQHDGPLPTTHSFIALEPPAVELSAVKKAEDRDALLVRVYNPTDAAQSASLTCGWNVTGAQLVTLEELPVDGGTLPVTDKRVVFEVGPKKIVTLALTGRCTRTNG